MNVNNYMKVFLILRIISQILLIIFCIEFVKESIDGSDSLMEDNKTLKYCALP